MPPPHTAVIPPIASSLHPLSPPFSFHLFSSAHSFSFLILYTAQKKKKRFPFKIKCVFVCSAIVEMGDRHRANNNQSEHNNAPLMWC